jgi:hypothetical protein
MPDRANLRRREFQIPQKPDRNAETKGCSFGTRLCFGATCAGILWGAETTLSKVRSSSDRASVS